MPPGVRSFAGPGTPFGMETGSKKIQITVSKITILITSMHPCNHAPMQLYSNPPIPHYPIPLFRL